jgi:putative tryptophan/tyrosine transport system substrate-binding protein
MTASYPRRRCHRMKRREVLTLLGGATAWPFAARAQQAAMPVIGFLHPGSAEPNASLLAAFRKGLAETGFTEGKNVAIEFRWAHGENSRLVEMAADLVQRQVAVLVTPIGTVTALAAKAATTTIPIVFSAGTDPVKAGIVASLRRPGGNVTGVNYMAAELSAKRLSLLHELTPGAARIALLVNPSNPVPAETITKDTEAAAETIGHHIDVLKAETSGEIETAFGALVRKRADALVVGADSFFIDRRVQIVTLATRYLLPTVHFLREFAEIGGLVSYGASNFGRNREIGIYTGRILKGEKPADMPVVQPTQFELVINQSTANAIGFTVPPSLLAQANEVIE